MQLREAIDQGVHIIEAIVDEDILKPVTIEYSVTDFCQRILGIKSILAYWSKYFWTDDHEIQADPVKFISDSVDSTTNMHRELFLTFQKLYAKESFPESNEYDVVSTLPDGQQVTMHIDKNSLLYKSYKKFATICKDLVVYYCYCCYKFDEKVFKSLFINNDAYINVYKTLPSDILICSSCGMRVERVAECINCHESAQHIIYLRNLRG